MQNLYRLKRDSPEFLNTRNIYQQQIKDMTDKGVTRDTHERRNGIV